MISRTTFRYPSAKFRGCPFWALNDDLRPAEIMRQIEEFKKAGMGGFFLHARTGLLTKYLSDEWMENIAAAVKRASELGLQAWLYDEDKWPSGYAGGLVPKQNPSFRTQALIRITKKQPLPENSTLVAETNRYYYLIAVMSMGDPWFNGTTYVDLMNPEAVKVFIDTTHEKYRSVLGDSFGKVIPGIFTDEPIARMLPYGILRDAEYVPYSPYLERRYRSVYRESPLKHVGELFEDTGEYIKYRYRYYRMMTEQFVEAFTRQISTWCKDKGIKLTGHYMYEDTIALQSRWIGNAMSHYEHMQQPGIDHLGLNIDNILTAKQCSSLAHQQGKRYVLSEMFGCSGQNMTFEDRKWIADWHAVMGISFVCQHLSLYALKGCRKRDYPPTFSYHQPYWGDNHFMEEYQARVSYITTRGKYKADFLIIHPGETGWCLIRGSKAAPKLKKLDEKFAGLLKKMFEIHRDFDLGNEDYLARHGQVSGNMLKVGQMEYRAVILPSMLSIRESTVKLLEAFKKSGGAVIAVGDLPEYMGGNISSVKNRLGVMISLRVNKLNSLEKALRDLCPPEWSLAKKTGTHQIYLQRRQLSDKEELLFLTNTSRFDTVVAVPLSKRTGYFKEYDLETGAARNAFVPFELGPAQSKALVFRDRKRTKTTPVRTGKTKEIVSLNGPWHLKRLDSNVLVLDFARWSTDNKKWRRPEPIIGIKQQLDHKKYNGPLWLRFTFTVKDRISCHNENEISLVVEQPGMFNYIKINMKTPVFNKNFYLDACLKKTAISTLVKEGLNTVELELDFVAGELADFDNTYKRYGTEIENIYIVGDFGVWGKVTEDEILPKRMFDDIWNKSLPRPRVRRLSPPIAIGKEEKISDGELIRSGYPFFAGTMHLSRTFTLEKIEQPAKYKMVFDRLDAITCNVIVNGRQAGRPLFWHPYEVDISGLLIKGENHLQLELKNSLRNLLGPHHHTMGELSSVGPYSFGSCDRFANKNIVDPGWSKESRRKKLKSWTDDYFVVRFGQVSPIRILEETE